MTPKALEYFKSLKPVEKRPFASAQGFLFAGFITACTSSQRISLWTWPKRSR